VTKRVQLAVLLEKVPEKVVELCREKPRPRTV